MRMRRTRFLAGRLAQTVPLILAVIVLNFLILTMVPGDLVDVIAGETGSATDDYVRDLRAAYGLDLTRFEQFTNYLRNVAVFDLGFSHRHGQTVASLILDRLPATLLLCLTSLTVAIAIGVLLGALSAKHQDGVLDEIVSFTTTLGFATPRFWAGLMLIVLLSVKWRWFPSSGMETRGVEHATWLAAALDTAHHLVLPVIALSLFYVSIYARITRAAMLEIYGMEFVRTARSKGLSEARVDFHHVLRNAAIPILTVTGLHLGSVMSGAVVVETVFSWPGVGRLAFEALQSRDINLLLGVFLFSCVLVAVLNIVIDVIYTLLDPRIEVA